MAFLGEFHMDPLCFSSWSVESLITTLCTYPAPWDTARPSRNQTYDLSSFTEVIIVMSDEWLTIRRRLYSLDRVAFEPGGRVLIRCTSPTVHSAAYSALYPLFRCRRRVV